MTERNKEDAGPLSSWPDSLPSQTTGQTSVVWLKCSFPICVPTLLKARPARSAQLPPCSGGYRSARLGLAESPSSGYRTLAFRRPATNPPFLPSSSGPRSWLRGQRDTQPPPPTRLGAWSRLRDQPPLGKGSGRTHRPGSHPACAPTAGTTQDRGVLHPHSHTSRAVCPLPPVTKAT